MKRSGLALSYLSLSLLQFLLFIIAPHSWAGALSKNTAFNYGEVNVHQVASSNSPRASNTAGKLGRELTCGWSIVCFWFNPLMFPRDRSLLFHYLDARETFVGLLSGNTSTTPSKRGFCGRVLEKMCRAKAKALRRVKIIRKLAAQMRKTSCCHDGR